MQTQIIQEQLNKIWPCWQVNEMIGSGSLSDVYRIERSENGHSHESALKVIRIPDSYEQIVSLQKKGMSEEEMSAFFYNIVETIVNSYGMISYLNEESNVVKYKEHAILANEQGIGWTIYIRLELLTPLLTYLENHSLTTKDLIRLGMSICQSLETCRKYNIVHGDIKPQNIFINKLGIYKLGDFRITRQVEQVASGYIKERNTMYMAPEIYWGEGYGMAADIYSLGIVLYQLLNNNRIPFLPPYPEKITITDLQQAISLRMNDTKIPAPANASEKLAKVILKACAYDVVDRYANPEEMRHDLYDILMEENKGAIWNKKDKNQEEETSHGGTMKLDTVIPTPVDSSVIVADVSDSNPVGDTMMDDFQSMSDYSSQSDSQSFPKSTFREMDSVQNASFSLGASEESGLPSSMEKVQEPISSSSVETIRKMTSPSSVETTKEKISPSPMRTTQEVVTQSPVKMSQETISSSVAGLAQEGTLQPSMETPKELNATSSVRLKSAHATLVSSRSRPATSANSSANIQNKATLAPSHGPMASQHKKKSKKKIVLSVMCTIGVLLVAGVGYKKSTESKVPYLLKMTLEEAQNKALDQSFSVMEAGEEYSNDVEKGHILSQSMSPGVVAKKRSVIEVVISRGPLIQAPQLVGKSQEEAATVLGELGLGLTVENEEYSDTVNAGFIIAQDIAEGTEMEDASTISVIVSKGMEQFEVPNVVGLSMEDANQNLAQNNLIVAVKEEYSDTVEAGLVIDQSVEPGNMVGKDTEVQIVVSKGVDPSTIIQTTQEARNNNNSSYSGGGNSAAASQPSNSSDGYTSLDDMDISNGD